MKQTLKIFLLMMVMLAPAAAGAQQNKEKMSREELAETQARHIASELAFDEATTNKFIETYCRCQKEIWALGSATMRHEGPLTEQQAREAIQYRFDHSQKMLDTRRKFYDEYSKFLTQLQIERVYQKERSIKTRIRGTKSVDKTSPARKAIHSPAKQLKKR